MLSELKRITENYSVILSGLQRMRELASTLGEHGSEIQGDIDKAGDMCKDCIKRFNSVCECLKDSDYRHIDHQMIAVESQMKVFEELTQKVHTDAIDLAEYFYIKK